MMTISDMDHRDAISPTWIRVTCELTFDEPSNRNVVKLFAVCWVAQSTFDVLKTNHLVCSLRVVADIGLGGAPYGHQ